MSNNFLKPPRQIEEIMYEIGDVYKGNDWLVVKKYMLKYSHPTHRKKFSTRDPKTKKHSINDYEENLIYIYYQKYNIRLLLDESKKHKA